MKYLEELKDAIERELEMFAKKGDISVNSLDKIHKLTDTLKNIDKIEMLEEGGGSSYEGGSSGARRGGGGGGGGGGRGGRSRESGGGSSYEGSESYDDDASYARRRRDRMGRYSGEGGYSQGDGKDHMMHKLGEMMEDADPKEREALRECMRALERI